MKTFRLFSPAIAATFSLAIASAVHAAIITQAPSYTYTFTAAPDDTTAYNGSTLTLTESGSDWTISGWDLVDGIAADALTDNGDSHVVSQSFTDVTGLAFVGNFSIDNALVFAAIHGNSDETVTYTGDGTDLSDNIVGDPPGTWLGNGLIGQGVPDASSTFELLLGGASLMGVCFRRIGRR